MVKSSGGKSPSSAESVHVPEKETPTGIPLDEVKVSRRSTKTKVVKPSTRKSLSVKAKTAKAKRSGSGKANRPKLLTIRSYQVGFGDCFLLTFQYSAHDSRHVLIDYGSTGLPKGLDKGDYMQLVADDIVGRVGSDPFAVVATHRHRDHISGFTTSKKHDETGDKIRRCKPKLVVQPWTEDPQLAPSAKAPPASEEAKGLRSFARALSNMQAVASSALEESRRLQGRAPVTLVKQLAFLGENNLANASAVKNLMTMGSEQRYVYFGSDSGFEAFLPGVTTRVLGPPTLKQSAEIATQRSKDADEFWHLQARSQSNAGLAAARNEGTSSTEPRDEAELFPDAARLDTEPPPYARWFVPRIRALRAEQMLEIVRVLDKAMNNTSVILLFQVGGKNFLFPGDAQIENWQYALSKPDIRDLLRSVDFYKVGHHGSLNATPKSLWNLFERKNTSEAADDRLRTVVSTMAGKHGEPKHGTEVPRAKLIDALQKSSHFSTTQAIKRSDLFEEITYDLT